VGSQVSPDGRLGVLVALRCETEPVGKNDEFQAFLKSLVDAVAKRAPKDEGGLRALDLPSGGTVSHGLTELVNRIRENISLGRFLRFEADAVVQYVHFDQKKAAMVAIAGGRTSDPKVAELGKELCMHIVFARPSCLSRDRLDGAVVAKEREILLAAAKNDPKNAKKPAEILAKIVEGQVEKFVASQCLLEQPYVRDEKITVAQFVKSSGTGATVVDFGYVATDV
jgi:elongation factor Ts